MDNFSKLRFTIVVAAAAYAAIPHHASAQNKLDPTTCKGKNGTYPLIVQDVRPLSCEATPDTAIYIGVKADGTGVELICGWGASSPVPVPSTYIEYAERNDQDNLARSVIFDGKKVIATKSIDLKQGAITYPVITEVLDEKTVIASNACDLDTSTNTPGNCKKIAPFVDEPQLFAALNEHALSCHKLVAQYAAGGSITNRWYSAKAAKARFAEVNRYIQHLTQ